jgi:outer membrane protein assembly factor BamB
MLVDCYSFGYTGSQPWIDCVMNLCGGSLNGCWQTVTFTTTITVNNSSDGLFCDQTQLIGGALLWKGEGAGAGSQLKGRYLNEVVYFSGGSSGFLHAVDARTGRTVWKLDPAKMGDGSDRWKPDLYVAPGENGEKGKVIALTPRNAYCFEAYR